MVYPGRIIRDHAAHDEGACREKVVGRAGICRNHILQMDGTLIMNSGYMEEAGPTIEVIEQKSDIAEIVLPVRILLAMISTAIWVSTVLRISMFLKELEMLDNHSIAVSALMFIIVGFWIAVGFSIQPSRQKKDKGDVEV